MGSGQTSSQQAVRWNPALAALSLCAIAALCGLPFLNTAPNRLVSGEPVYFFTLLHGACWLIGLLAVLLFVLSLARPKPVVLLLSVAASALLLPCLLWLAAAQAAALALVQSPIARTSLGGAFWLALLLSWLMAGDGLQRLRAGALLRACVAAAVVLPVTLLLSSGFCDQLSLMKEYENRSGEFMQMLGRHVEIVCIALLLAVCTGLPLGVAAHRHARVGSALFPLLNIAQTVPSIAMFGLLMAPLALLAATVPALGGAGISGVGLAPAVIALVLYGLLPVVRGMLAGLAQVPSSVIEAAQGMGMSAAAIFWRVEAPLALPVVLAGLRTAAVQLVGLAAVTSLIGAGGLGSIMFEGLFSSAQDLVLLGVLPMLLLGAFAGLLFNGLIRLTRLPTVEGVSA